MHYLMPPLMMWRWRKCGLIEGNSTGGESPIPPILFYLAQFVLQFFASRLLILLLR